MPIVSINSEIPEDLQQQLSTFIETHPNWDCNRAATVAIALFLIQEGVMPTRSVRHYLDARFVA